MVYIEKDKKLGKAKRNYCCKIIPEDEKNLNRIIQRRKKNIAKEIVRDARGTRKEESEKLLKVEDRLHEKRGEAEVKRADLVEQWKTLKSNEEDFRSVFIEFHKFTVDNREKIDREQARIENLKQNRAAKEFAIEKTKEELDHFRTVYDRMKQELERHMIYETFLKKFAECTRDKHIRDVLSRYELLLESREHTEEITNSRLLSTLQHATNFEGIVQNWGGIMLKFNEKLTMQAKKFEEAKRQVFYWEKTVHNIKRNAQRVWTDVETTRVALNHVVSLLLIRMKARKAPGSFDKDKTFLHLLNTTEGKILYLNKMLGDLMRVKNEVLEIYQAEKRTDKVHTKRKKNIKVISLLKQKLQQEKSVAPKQEKIPKSSADTAKILETLMRTKSKWRSTRRDVPSQKSYETTNSEETQESWEPRARAMTSWFITKEGRKNAEKRQEMIPAPLASNQVSEVASRLESIPRSKRSEHTTNRYSCVSLTTDPTSNLVDEKRTKMRDRIIERNFDRYEKYVFNNMDTDSSVMKINKDTGKLELPKLKYKPKCPPEKKSIGIVLPKIEPGSLRKLKKKRDDTDTLIKTISLCSSSHKSVRSKKEWIVLEEIRRFLSRPTIMEKFTYGNLS